jgi:hypothetical protein
LKSGEVAIGPDPVLHEMENLTNKTTLDIDMING